jgi:predicted NBD/HSP70 family sugar kinase
MIFLPSRIGKLNKRALLDCLHRMGTASRADLAKSLGLSQPTAGKIVDELVELGVLEEVDVLGNESGQSPKLGRPARMLRLTQIKARFLGLQLGIAKTNLTPLPLSVSDEDNWTIHFATPETAREWVKQLRKAAAKISQKSFWGILVSVPGLVDERKIEVIYSPNLHWTEKIDLSSLIQQVWRAPVILVQEERALALGHHAADPGGEDFLLVDFGEGVGGAVMIAGKLHHHPLPIGGEIGHAPIIGNERQCGCGAIGCLETLISTRGLLRSFAAASRKRSSTWESLSKSIAENGIAPWLAKTLETTAAVIACALNVLGLRRIVITGTITELPPMVFEFLSSAIEKGSLWARFGKLKIEKAPRRRRAGLVAAGIERLVVPTDNHNAQKPHFHSV